jgi:hypothetical protein
MVERPYDVLAESDKTESMIIAHKNSFMCVFKVDKCYQETIRILLNFLLHFLDQTQFGHRLDRTLEEAQTGRLIKANMNPDPRVNNLPTKKLQESLAALSPRTNDDVTRMLS